jgi:aspartate aminotransferase
MRLSVNATRTPTSGIRDIVHRAMEVDGAIRLEAGEGTLLTPPHIVTAALADAANGATRYTASAGIPELRTALCEKLDRGNGVLAREDNVAVSAGGVQGLFLVFAALCDAGEAVLAPNPGWPNYEMICRLLGLRCDTYPCVPENGFVPDLADVEARITSETRLLVVNSPNNPTGVIYPRYVVEELAALAARRGLVLISDEAYDALYFDDPPTAASSLAPVEDGAIVSVFSFSKTYAMTGWRVGYVVGPSDLVRTLAKLQEPTISCVSAVSQRAALAALRDERGFPAEQRQLLRARCDTVMGVLDERGELTYKPEGAFYMLLSVAPLDSTQFAFELLQSDRIAVAPGAAFGSLGDPFVRICYAAGGDALEPAVRRLLERRDELIAARPAASKVIA